MTTPRDQIRAHLESAGEAIEDARRLLQSTGEAGGCETSIEEAEGLEWLTACVKTVEEWLDMMVERMERNPNKEE